MNTANLQLEGLTLAIVAINRKLVERNILTRHEIDAALSDAAAVIGTSDSSTTVNQDVILFPLRVLRLANATSDSDRIPSFQDLARAIGEATPES